MAHGKSGSHRGANASRGRGWAPPCNGCGGWGAYGGGCLSWGSCGGGCGGGWGGGGCGDWGGCGGNGGCGGYCGGPQIVPMPVPWPYPMMPPQLLQQEAPLMSNTGCAPGTGCALHGSFTPPAAEQDYRLALASLGASAPLVGPDTGAFGSAALSALGSVSNATNSVLGLMPAMQMARDALQRVRSLAALQAAPAASLFAPAAPSGPATSCPNRSCVVYELRALNDTSGQPLRTAQVPDRTPIEVIGEGAGVIVLEGAEPRRWSHVRLRATDGSTIEGWMKPENLASGASPSTGASTGCACEKLVPTSTGQKAPSPEEALKFGLTVTSDYFFGTPESPTQPSNAFGRYLKNAVLLAPALRERAEAARRMGQPAAIVAALESQARTAPNTVNDLKRGQVVRIDLRIGPGGLGLRIPSGLSPYTAIRVTDPNLGETYQSETVHNPEALRAAQTAYHAIEVQLAAIDPQIAVLRTQPQMWGQLQTLEAQRNSLMAARQSILAQFPPPWMPIEIEVDNVSRRGVGLPNTGALTATGQVSCEELYARWQSATAMRQPTPIVARLARLYEECRQQQSNIRPGQLLRIHRRSMPPDFRALFATLPFEFPVIVFRAVQTTRDPVIASVAAVSNGDTTRTVPFNGLFGLSRDLIARGAAKRIDSIDYREIAAEYRRRGNIAQADRYTRLANLAEARSPAVAGYGAYARGNP